MVKPKILLADDDVINHEILKKILQEKYDLLEAFNGQEAIDMYNTYEDQLSLVLLDIVMPNKDGIEVMKELQQNKPLEVPVIFVTGEDTQELEGNSIRLGAADYIRKPFNTDVLKARIAAQIALKQNTNQLKEEIEEGVAERTKIINSLVIGLATVVEYRSLESGEHIKRVQDVARMIIDKLKSTTNLLDEYSYQDMTYMTYAAAMHDIGKVGIRDAILKKPGKFTDEEYEEMIENFYIGEDKRMMQFCKEVCRHHHEKWDGTGYPDKLKGTEIPIVSRIVCIADSFDAIVSQRVYKEGQPLEKGFEIIEKDAGTYFDPQIVEVFLSLKKELGKEYERRV